MSAAEAAAPLRGLVRVGAAAAMVAGGLRIASTFIPYQSDNAGLEALYGVIDVCLLLGLIAIHIVAAETVGAVGLAGFVIALTGLASIVGPDAMAFGVDVYRVGALTFVGGLAMMAVAMLRVAVMRWVAGLWLLTFAASLAATVAPQAFVISGVCLGLAFVLAGWSLRERASRRAPGLATDMDAVA